MKNKKYKNKKKYKKNKYYYEYVPPKIEYIYNSIYSLNINQSSIKNAGLWVFTNENIHPNKFIGYYIGKKFHKNILTYAIQLDSDYYIEAINYPRCIFAMINDSRFSDYTYNCEFLCTTDNIEVWSTKFIPVNTELFINYGDEYWLNR